MVEDGTFFRKGWLCVTVTFKIDACLVRRTSRSILVYGFSLHMYVWHLCVVSWRRRTLIPFFVFGYRTFPPPPPLLRCFTSFCVCRGVFPRRSSFIQRGAPTLFLCRPRNPPATFGARVAHMAPTALCWKTGHSRNGRCVSL